MRVVFMSGLLLVGSIADAAEEEQLPTSVLVITVDALRADRMSVYGHERETTPYLDSLADEAFLFESAFADSGWTSPGIVSMFTGFHAPVHAQNSRFSFYDDLLPAPVWHLRRARRYQTYARENSGPTMGGLGFQYRLGSYADLEEFVEHRVEKGGKRAFFAWLHIKDTHLPYDPPPFDARRFGASGHDSAAVQAVRSRGVIKHHDAPFRFEEADVPVVQGLYDGEVVSADARIGRALETLRSAGILDRTIVVISADHGEELLQHGWVGHASTSHIGRLYDEVMHIPLIIRVPHGALVGRSSALVQQADVMPTVFELLGEALPETPTPYQGQSLVPIMRGEAEEVRDVVFSQTSRTGWGGARERVPERVTAVRSARYKLIRYPESSEKRYEAFDLSQDPTEQVDIWPTRREELRELEAALAAKDDENREAAGSLLLYGMEAVEREVVKALAEGRKADAARRYADLVRLVETWSLEEHGAVEVPKFKARIQQILRRAKARLSRG